MDYEKKYKDALAKAKDCLKDGTITSTAIDYISTIFPELAESEDEKFRKYILGCCKETIKVNDRGLELSMVTTKKLKNWLEKQREFGTFDVPQTSIKDAVEVTSRMPFISDDMKPIAEFIMGYANWDLHKDEWNQPTLTVPLFRVLDALIQRGKPYGECSQNIEKQGEQKPFDYESVNIQQTDFAPKQEPKFKVGDWIVNNEDGTVGQITNIHRYWDNSYGYEHTNGHFHGAFEKDYHLWTIADAKNGDVVVDKSDGTIGIFQSIGHHPDGGSYNDHSYCFLHCRYDDGYFFADFDGGNIMTSDDVIPATKEQRDLLFAEMEEAGYEWDAEKKKLRKIKPIWGTVDLGLPSGTLWATMNVGATSETDYGLHFAWGDTQGYTSSQVGTGSGQKAFSWNDYKFGTESNLTKYNSTNRLTTLELTDDASYSLSNGQYVIPTKEQFDELIANTTSSWDSARSGYTFTSKVNGNSIFFPAAGGCDDGSVDGVGSWGYYWSSSLSASCVSDASGLLFGRNNKGVCNDERCYGGSVRGVIIGMKKN